MKILLLGNSMVGCLLEAYRPNIHLLGYQIAFIVAPGADGPDLMIRNNRLYPRDMERFPHNRPFCWPSGAWLEKLKNQHAVIIGALGFLDDPKFPDLSLLGRFILPCFRIREGVENHPPPVTRSVAAASLRGQWSTQPGALLSKKLRQLYAGRILVMPYPAPAQSILNDRSCHLAKIYEEPSEAAHFFESLRQTWLKDWCRENQLDLLELHTSAPDSLLTPDYLLAADRFHMAPCLSNEILKQIDRCMARTAIDKPGDRS
jgi:hypothetical protein